jgi:NTE family protein
MPVPVRPARDLAPELPLVAVNLQGDYPGRSRLAGIHRPRLTTLSVFRASMGLMLNQLARQSLDLDPPDLELALPVGHIDTSNFTRAEELVRLGHDAAVEALPRIRALAA